jgi:hypothetical protein
MLGSKERIECRACGTVIKVRKDAPRPCPSCGHLNDPAPLVRDDTGVWRDPAAVAVAKAMSRGLEEIAPLLESHGFGLTERDLGKDSGGYYATADFTRGDRSVHLWLRGGLGVHYEVAGESLDHAAYMLALLGRSGGNRFPPYLHDQVEAFHALRYDLERFCGDLLEGSGDEFRRCCREAEQRRGESGFQRVARLERELEQRPD